MKTKRNRKEQIKGLTIEQRKSYKRICQRYGQQPMDAFISFDSVLMLIFSFIVIGIERDGYAHS